MLEEKWPEFVAWCKSINLVRDPYNNKDYNGNNCNKLLNKLEELKKVIPEDFLIFSETLDALKNVKISCFGAEAHPDYKERINEFEAKWEELYINHDIWFTNKVHVIIDHVPQAIERTGRGLLGNSEQVVEATHAKFEQFWLKYVVVDLESDIHGERLLECVIDFNSSNI